MKEQIISFETAKLAKEKGFYPKRTVSFLTEDNSTFTFGGFIDNTDKWVKNFYFSKECKDFDNKELYIRTPQSLFQKWLREFYKIDVNVMSRFKDKNTKFYKVSIYTINEVLTKDIIGDTYEEALEKGLQEALKLI